MNGRFFSLIIVFFFGFMLFCSDPDKNIKEKIVLKLANIEITHYEMQKRIDRFKKKYKQIYRQDAPADSIESYINSFADDVYILAEAFNRGYYNDADIDSLVDFMTRKILTQPKRGQVYERLILDRVKITDDILYDAFNKNKKEFKLKILKFADHQDMHKTLGPDTLLSLERFEKVAHENKNSQFVNIFEAPFIWPSYGIWKVQDKIFQMKKGEISPPLHANDGIYIIYVKDISTRNQKTFEEERPSLEWSLKNIYEEKLFLAVNDSMFKACNLVINNDACEEFFKLIPSSYSVILEKETFAEILGDTIETYQYDNEKNNVTVDGFLDFYSKCLIKKPIISKDMLKDYLKELVREKCYYQYAKNHNILEQPQLKLDIKNYKNKVVLSKFIDNELKKNIKVSEDELLHEYENNINSFKQVKSIIANLFYFNSDHHAYKSLEKLKNCSVDSIKYITKDGNLNGLLKTEFNRKLDYNSSLFNEMISNRIQRLRPEQFSFPLRLEDGSFLIVQKLNDQGNVIKSFDEVRDYLNKKILDLKVNNEKPLFIKSLKEKYTPEISVDKKQFLL